MKGFEDRITMSQRERDVLKVLQTVVDGKRSQAEAARLLDLTARHAPAWHYAWRRKATRPWCMGCAADCPTAGPTH